MKDAFFYFAKIGGGMNFYYPLLKSQTKTP